MFIYIFAMIWALIKNKQIFFNCLIYPVKIRTKYKLLFGFNNLQVISLSTIIQVELLYKKQDSFNSLMYDLRIIYCKDGGVAYDALILNYTNKRICFNQMIMIIKDVVKIKADYFFYHRLDLQKLFWLKYNKSFSFLKNNLHLI